MEVKRASGKEERGKRKEERGKRKEERGKRKEERGKRKEERRKIDRDLGYLRWDIECWCLFPWTKDEDISPWVPNHNTTQRNTSAALSTQDRAVHNSGYMEEERQRSLD
jgi:hypothetical protein